MHAEQRRARLDLVGRATSDGTTHVLGAIPPQLVSELTVGDVVTWCQGHKVEDQPSRQPVPGRSLEMRTSTFTAR